MAVNPTKALQLTKELSQQGIRLFSLGEARKAAQNAHINIKSVKTVLFSLKKQGAIHSLKRDLYCLDSLFLGGHPLHEFEIATHLAVPSVISHLSAFHYHQLTDQIPRIIYATVPAGTSIPRVLDGKFFTYKGIEYYYSRIKQEYFFGAENVWVGTARVPITDRERTLLDGLIKPQYCGGIQEVLSAYLHSDELNISKLVEYALRLDISVAKRLGWVLEYIGLQNKEIETLEKLPFKGFIKLDSSAAKEGPYNKRWQIQENI